MLRGIFGYAVWTDGLITKHLNGESMAFVLTVYVLLILATAATAYFFGSVNTAVIISKVMYHDDIRTKGSGNAGMTNMMRTYGKGPAAMTLIGDMLKAMLGMVVGTLLLGLNGAYLAGLFCVIGHIFPAFYKFKGGKGVASTAMVLLYIDWRVFLIVLAMFILITWGTKYLSLASVTCMLFIPLLLYRFELVPTDRPLRLITSMLMCALVVFMHRSNISRIMNGTENKFKFKKTVKQPSNEPQNEIDEKK